MKFFGADVLATGEGQCTHCAAKVIRVLVNDGSHRKWQTTVPEAGKLVPHACPESERAYQKPDTTVPTAPEAA